MLLIISIVLCSIILFFKDLIFQEGNPIPIVIAIVNLETKDVNLVKITGKQNRYLVRRKKDDNGEYELPIGNWGFTPFIKYKEKYGWKFIRQMGSSLVFEKDGNESIVSTRVFTRRYIVIKDNYISD